MKTLKALIILTIFTLSAVAIAHQNHDEPEMEISKSEAIMIARNAVNEKIEAKELDEIWGSTESKSAGLERLNGRQVWKISLSQKAGDTAEILNVFVSKTGLFISISK